jgi:hypothetical protein
MTKQKTAELNCTLKQMDLPDIYRIFHSMTENIISSAHETFSSSKRAQQTKNLEMEEQMKLKIRRKKVILI